MAVAQNFASTVTGSAIIVALRKRLQSEGFKADPTQLQTIMLDIMTAISANSGTVVSDASTELTNSPARPFVFGV